MSGLANLYRRVPGIACKGLCADSCGPIVVGKREHDAMLRASGGKRLTVDADTLTCGYLKDGRCTVHAVRPLICRLWGVVPELPCAHGCTVERVLTRPEAKELLRTLERVGGKPVKFQVEANNGR